MNWNPLNWFKKKPAPAPKPKLPPVLQVVPRTRPVPVEVTLTARRAAEVTVRVQQRLDEERRRHDDYFGLYNEKGLLDTPMTWPGTPIPKPKPKEPNA